MLTIAPETFAVLESASRPLFAESLREELADMYSHFLPRFPEPVQAKIVANMLGRASGWGLSRQASLTTYCELMITIAANFDEEREVRGAAERHSGQLDRLFGEIGHHVSDDGWERAERNGSNLPFFVAPALAGEPLARRSAAAVALALADRPEAADSARAVAEADEAIAALGIGGVDDAALVVVAARSFLGPQPPCFAQVREERWPPRAAVEVIRLAIALEVGRFV